MKVVRFLYDNQAYMQIVQHFYRVSVQIANFIAFFVVIMLWKVYMQKAPHLMYMILEITSDQIVAD